MNWTKGTLIKNPKAIFDPSTLCLRDQLEDNFVLLVEEDFDLSSNSSDSSVDIALE